MPLGVEIGNRKIMGEYTSVLVHNFRFTLLTVPRAWKYCCSCILFATFVFLEVLKMTFDPFVVSNYFVCICHVKFLSFSFLGIISVIEFFF